VFLAPGSLSAVLNLRKFRTMRLGDINFHPSNSDTGTGGDAPGARRFAMNRAANLKSQYFYFPGADRTCPEADNIRLPRD
jgi:hypothetical protein